MAVQANILPSQSVKTLGAMKAERTVKRITFNPTEANPGNTLYVSVPKLHEDEVIVAGTLSLLFDLDLTDGHANNYLANTALITAKHIKLETPPTPPNTPTRDSEGYPLEGVDEVDSNLIEI